MENRDILHVIARMNVGGTSRYIDSLIKGMPGSILATGYVQGVEIEDKSTLIINPVRIPHLGRKISFVNDLCAYFELRSVVRHYRPKIIHTHTFKAGLLGRLIKGQHKHVHTFHGHLLDDNEISRFEKKVLVFCEKILAKRTDLFISIGSRVGAELRSAGIGQENKWASIPPGLEIQKLLDKKVARKSFGLQSDKLIFGWLGRLISVKDPLLLIKLAEKFPEIDFAIGGGGELFEKVKFKKSANVYLLGWVDASPFWSAIDIAISTSESEGMPIALIEAQIAGIPVIATNVGSTSEVIQDGVTGILTSREEQAIVDAIQKLSENKELRNDMAENAKARATKLFSIERMVASHIEVYKSLIDAAVV